MPPQLDREGLRATLAGFDERQKKIVGGVIAVMIENPDRVREREWITEQFTQVALLASGFEDVAGTQEGLTRIQGYVRANVDPLLNACFQLFLCVGEDMAQDGEVSTQADALARALGYFSAAP